VSPRQLRARLDRLTLCARTEVGQDRDGAHNFTNSRRTHSQKETKCAVDAVLPAAATGVPTATIEAIREALALHVGVIAGDSSFRSGRWMDLRISAFLDRTPHVRSGRDGVCSIGAATDTDRRSSTPSYTSPRSRYRPKAGQRAPLSDYNAASARGRQINLIFVAYEVPALLGRPFLRRLNKSPAQLIEMDQRRGNPFQCFIGLAVSYVLQRLISPRAPFDLRLRSPGQSS
jgi:hypothetical protein